MSSAHQSKSRSNRDEENTLENMMNVVNLAKRLASLEKCVQKLTWVVEKLKESDSSFPLTKNLSNGNLEKAPSESSPKLIDLTTQNDTINLNQFNLNQQICNIQKQMGKVEGQIDDIFFACEQNDEKIDDTILGMNDFNSQIFCIKSDVKGLLDDSREFKKKIVEMNEKYETMNNVKANRSEMDEQLKFNMKIMFGELEKMVKVRDHDEVIDAFRMRMAVNEESFQKFRCDMKKSFACLLSSLDEKLDKSEMKNFKSTVADLFDNFVNDLKILFLNVGSQNEKAMGASKHLQTNLKCIACNSKVSMAMATDFPEIQRASSSFKNKLWRVKTPTKKLKPGVFCAKNFFNAKKIHSRHQSPQFPSSTQQCFIISEDNTIVRADPLKCLLLSTK